MRIYLFLAFLILVIPAVSSIGTQLYCLEEGQKLEFSKCNPDIPDKVCKSTSCQICATENSEGIFCPANINKCNSACVYLEEEEVEEDPEITLMFPPDNSIENSSKELDFQFQITRSYTIDSCSIFLNEEEIEESENRIHSLTNRISASIEEGVHKWKIQCITRNNDQSIESEERTLTINNERVEENYEIDLISPEPEFTTTGAQEITFSYEFKDINPNELDICSLFLNNNKVKNINQTNTTQIKYLIPVGTHSWKIQCADINDNEIDSNERFITINQPPQNNQQNQNSGGGGGSPRSSGSSRNQIPKNTTNATFINLNENSNIEQLSNEVEKTNLESTDDNNSKSTINKTKLYFLLITTFSSTISIIILLILIKKS